MLLPMNVDTPSQSDAQQNVGPEVTIPLVTDSRADGVRHRLTPEQRRELGQLYSETGVSVAVLRQRFNVSEPSVYRILQTQGIALRGRTTAVATPANGTAKPASNAQPRKRAAFNASRGSRSRTTVPRSHGMSPFRIEYRAERTLDAVDFRDALRQAESLGAADIVGLTREH
jgi:transposase-like protein